MNTPLENEIAKRFGVLPNFFRLASGDPKIAANFWGFAQFAYLDNPLPSLFKERLFVYLSRFCEVRYCIARHVGFLVGLGYPAGDSACVAQTVESILPLLRRPLPQGDRLLPLFAVCSEFDSPLSFFPGPDSLGEQALFACATHVFLQTPDALPAHEVLRRALGPLNLEQLNLLLAFVRTAHYWTKLHPELAFEDDVNQLLAANETLAHCILKDPGAQTDSLSRQVAAELSSLRKLRKQHEGMTQAYQELSVNHQYVRHSLHESEENLRELVSVMPAAVYACDKEGILTYYNRKATEIWGRTPDLDGAPWSFLDSRRLYRLDGTLLRPEEAPIKEVLATGVPIVNCEFVLERPDLSRIHVLTNLAPLRDSAGAVTGAVSIFQDITELKRIQQEREVLLHELERSNRELSEFSYAVSHDLKAPVGNVRALTQLLARRGQSLQEDSSQLLSLIEQTAAGMERLIESLLQYAQAGQGQLNRQRVPVDQIVESIRVTLAPLITKTGAQIVSKALPAVEADPVLLEQLLQNLVANAIQYHRPEEAPVVEISGARAGAEWQFAVKDNGEGIPRDQQGVIFEPLKRLHGSETPGTGLGLALCRTILARHGGRIWVESEGSGCGATFRFALSAAQEPTSMVHSSTVD
ncbi:MAG TPA: ATP-binding protein [Bryobacteraceae bacterium]|nr:ATP-binding protein [Bryobacteraceae bacterium]